MATVIYHCPQMANLAQKIYKLAALPDCMIGEIKWNKFPDGFPDYQISDHEMVKNNNIIFLASFDTPAEIFNQLSIIYALPRYLARSLKVILPYYPTGTMERVETQGQIATAMTLARMLSTTPPTQCGPAQIIIYDIHALQEQFYFSDQVLIRLETAVQLIKDCCPADEFSVAFPDEGAGKRFAHFFDGYSQIICEKIRDGDKRIIRIKQGNPKGKKVLLIDDLIQSGLTLIETAKVLMKRGAKDVQAYATHGVFPQESWKNFIDCPISKVYITDSCPQTVKQVKGLDKFKVLSLATLIKGILIEEREKK